MSFTESYCLHSKGSELTLEAPISSRKNATKTYLSLRSPVSPFRLREDGTLSSDPLIQFISLIHQPSCRIAAHMRAPEVYAGLADFPVPSHHVRP
jgi:hypothetical protein